MEPDAFWDLSSWEIFQKRLDEAIEGLEGVRSGADDIIVIGCGETIEEVTNDHDQKLKQLLEASSSTKKR